MKSARSAVPGSQPERSPLEPIESRDVSAQRDVSEPLPVVSVVKQRVEMTEDGPQGALAADPPLIPTDDLIAELAEHSKRLETATPQEILSWAVERFAPKFSMATPAANKDEAHVNLRVLAF